MSRPHVTNCNPREHLPEQLRWSVGVGVWTQNSGPGPVTEQETLPTPPPRKAAALSQLRKRGTYFMVMVLKNQE